MDQLCAVAALAGETQSPVRTIEKMEGGFSKAMLMQKEDGSEVVAKIPFPIAGPPKYTTASEVAVLQYGKASTAALSSKTNLTLAVVQQHTQVPVPKVLAWSSDTSNPVGAEYMVMEKAYGSQLVQKWSKMEKYDHLTLVTHLTILGLELTNIRFPANGSLYRRESLTEGQRYETLDLDMDPSEQFCVGPSCEREWIRQQDPESGDGFNRGPCESPLITSSLKIGTHL